MALFGRGQSGGMMNVIRCDEEQYLVWKWRPLGQDVNSTSRENSIRYGSSLRVKEGEVAVFVYKQKDGTTQDFIEGPYDDTIKTANFPVLSSLVGLAFGGESPFQAEVYFINLQSNNQIRFGIPYFDVTDPNNDYLPVPVAVRGTMTFALEDYRNFIKLNRLINFDLEAFKNQIRDTMIRKIKGIITNVPHDLQMPLVRIESKVDEISDLVEQRLNGRMEEFGVTMKHIDLSAIELDKENSNYAELKAQTANIISDTRIKQSEINLRNLDDMQKLNTENMAETMRIQREEAQRAQKLQTETNFMGAHALNQQTDVLKTGAQSLGQMGQMGLGGGMGMNPGGAMAGMMMGGALGQQMAGMMQNVGQQVQMGMQQPPAMPQSQYFVNINNQQAGPFFVQQLAQMAQSGQITAQSYVWKQGMPQWELAGNVQELKPLFAPAMPQMPPMPPMPGGGNTPPPMP
ncbi:MAG: SPFH domain-containing protein [Bacteroidales bacterium]|nr:SPFH domain-containing protein [Bacteroidales bacterium]